MLEPFSTTELNDGTAITFDVRAVDALVWHEVLPLDPFAAVGIRTVHPPLWAVFARMLFNAASGNQFIAVLIGTSYFEVVAHVHNQSRGLLRSSK